MREKAIIVEMGPRPGSVCKMENIKKTINRFH